MIQYNNRGTQYSDNLIDNLLSFNVSSTWSTVGTGTALLDASKYFEGSGSLRLTNNAYKTTELVANNTVQSTIIKFDGVYDFSLYLNKTLAEDMSVTVEIYNNASLVYDTALTLSDTDVWTSFITNENFNFLKGDEITFKFKINNNASSAVTSASLWIDGLHLYNKERNQLEAPFYSKPISSKIQVFGSYNYQDDGTTSIPLTVAGDWYKITNNAGGALTTSDGGYIGITPYNTTTNNFDLDGLDIHDEIEVRFDLKATTTTTNVKVEFRINIASGAAYLQLEGAEYDVAVTDEQITAYIPVGVLTVLAKSSGFILEAKSDKTGTTITVNGWYVKVNKRLV